MITGVEALRYDVLDVFTDGPYAGNPLAVVHGGADLSTTGMQAIAAEFGLSETAFPLPPTAAEATYRLRIFTPAHELPFAGHPSVGAAWLLSRDVVQECGAGGCGAGGRRRCPGRRRRTGRPAAPITAVWTQIAVIGLFMAAICVQTAVIGG